MPLGPQVEPRVSSSTGGDGPSAGARLPGEGRLLCFNAREPSPSPGAERRQCRRAEFHRFRIVNPGFYLSLKICKQEVMRGVTTSPWQVTATPHWLNFSSQVVLFIFHMNEASVCTQPLLPSRNCSVILGTESPESRRRSEREADADKGAPDSREPRGAHEACAEVRGPPRSFSSQPAGCIISGFFSDIRGLASLVPEPVF